MALAKIRYSETDFNEVNDPIHPRHVVQSAKKAYQTDNMVDSGKKTYQTDTRSQDEDSNSGNYINFLVENNSVTSSTTIVSLYLAI